MAARLAIQQRRNWKTTIFWLYGATGTGKSRWAHEQDPEAYIKEPTTKWWDGYDGEATVIIDDARRDMCTFAYMLRLFDRYPLPIETKGGTCQFLARTIYFTSPFHPRQFWEGRCTEDLKQLLRRIEHIRHYTALDTFEEEDQQETTDNLNYVSTFNP